MVSKFPDQFSGEYPSTDEARAAALKDLTLPNKIGKKSGPRGMHRSFYRNSKRNFKSLIYSFFFHQPRGTSLSSMLQLVPPGLTSEIQNSHLIMNLDPTN